MERRDGSAGRGPRVVVVGAGFAAAGAARQLTQGGITDVTLLEASDRPGGRVQTLVLDGGFLELGGQFLHGRTELYRFAQQEGLLKADDEEESEEDEVPDTVIQYQGYTFRTPGGAALDQQVVNHNLQVLEQLCERVIAAQNDGAVTDGDVHVSVGHFLRSLYPEYLERMAGDQEVKAAMIKWLEDWHVLDSATTVQELSLPGTCRYRYERGSGVLETRHGMWDVFQRLLRDSLPAHRLLLNKAVSSVHWDGRFSAALAVTLNNNVEEDVQKMQALSQITSQVSGQSDRQKESDRESSEYNENPSHIADKLSEKQGADIEKSEPPGFSSSSPNSVQSDFRVAVHCEDGDVLFADHVIVTSSVGFLKEHSDFFVPSLPQRHVDAIKSIGFGNVAKVFLMWDLDENAAADASGSGEGAAASEWKRRLLGDDSVEGLIPLWPEDVQPTVKSAKSSLRTSMGRQWYEEICLMEFITSYDPCLLVWVSGEGASIMETLPVSEVKEVTHELLVLFLGKPDLPPPSRLVRSEWHNNPYTRGAYSYLATGVPLELHDMLRQPLPSTQDPVLQFAGEACSQNHYSTAHGALSSGQQAAGTILRHYNMLH